MNITIELMSPYKDIAKVSKIKLKIDAEATDVKGIIDVFFKQKPTLYDLFKENKLIKESKLKAIYSVDNKIVKEDYKVEKDCVIRILYPIAGG